MFERLEEIEKRYEEIESEMATPEALANMEEYKKLAKERVELKGVIDIYRDWKKKKGEHEKTQELLGLESDEEMKTLAKEETALLEEELANVIVPLAGEDQPIPQRPAPGNHSDAGARGERLPEPQLPFRSVA